MPYDRLAGFRSVSAGFIGHNLVLVGVTVLIGGAFDMFNKMSLFQLQNVQETVYRVMISLVP